MAELPDGVKLTRWEVEELPDGQRVLHCDFVLHPDVVTLGIRVFPNQTEGEMAKIMGETETDKAKEKRRQEARESVINPAQADVIEWRKQNACFGVIDGGLVEERDEGDPPRKFG